jgi:hypothetical protein
MELATGLTVGTELDWARLQDMYTRAAEASDTEAKPSLPRKLQYLCLLAATHKNNVLRVNVDLYTNVASIILHEPVSFHDLLSSLSTEKSRSKLISAFYSLQIS